MQKRITEGERLPSEMMIKVKISNGGGRQNIFYQVIISVCQRHFVECLLVLYVAPDSKTVLYFQQKVKPQSF